MWYVYILYDPRNNKPFYVGKGTKRRLSTTINPNQTGNGLKRLFLEEIQAINLKPTIEIVGEFKEESDALAVEKNLVANFGRIIKGTGCLTNYSEGGECSNAGWIPSAYTRKLWSTQRRGVRQKDEHVRARVEKTKGKTRTDEQKRKYVLASIRRTNPELKASIIHALEEEQPKHGTFSRIAKKFNCDINLISRIHKDIDLYKEALNEWIKK
jgi:hypothetical protein